MKFTHPEILPLSLTCIFTLTFSRFIRRIESHRQDGLVYLIGVNGSIPQTIYLMAQLLHQSMLISLISLQVTLITAYGGILQGSNRILIFFFILLYGCSGLSISVTLWRMVNGICDLVGKDSSPNTHTYLNVVLILVPVLIDLYYFKPWRDRAH